MIFMCGKINIKDYICPTLLAVLILIAKTPSAHADNPEIDIQCEAISDDHNLTLEFCHGMRLQRVGFGYRAKFNDVKAPPDFFRV